MARLPRIELPGVPLHVIQRGNNRGPCFLDDADRRLYLRCLGEAATRHGCAIHAYVLMPNHVHLLVTPGAAGCIAAMMQSIGRRYVRLFNDCHNRTGTLWEGRYKASLVDCERYFLTCQRYIELNPVRASIVEHAANYPWSSHRHYAFGACDALLTPHALFNALAEDETARRAAYRELFEECIAPDLLDQIRANTNRGWAFGSETFLCRVEAALGRAARPPKRGRPFKRIDDGSSAAEPDTEMLI